MDDKWFTDCWNLLSLLTHCFIDCGIWIVWMSLILQHFHNILELESCWFSEHTWGRTLSWWRLYAPTRRSSRSRAAFWLAGICIDWWRLFPAWPPGGGWLPPPRWPPGGATAPPSEAGWGCGQNWTTYGSEIFLTRASLLTRTINSTNRKPSQTRTDLSIGKN